MNFAKKLNKCFLLVSNPYYLSLLLNLNFKIVPAQLFKFCIPEISINKWQHCDLINVCLNLIFIHYKSYIEDFPILLIDIIL